MIKNLAFIFVIFFSCCNSVLNKNDTYNNEIRCIQVKQVFPVIQKDGKVPKYDSNFVKIYYYKDMAMYHLGYHYSYTKNKVRLITEDRDHFFIHKKGEVFGYDYDKNKSEFGVKMPVDSLLNKQWISVTQIYPMIFENSSTLVSSKWNLDSSILDEMYIYRSKQDTAMTGSVHLSFTNKMMDINYSMSKELDSMKNMKLYKAKLSQDSRYVNDFKVNLDEFHIIHGFEEVKITSPKEILAYFERYKKDILKDSIL
ncbi:MAG: hypothetical protein IPJ81_13795 [Chitinophagaceae bacterium]|nr:hypothetical protein [Chitinophagaceae bacterium]